MKLSKLIFACVVLIISNVAVAELGAVKFSVKSLVVQNNELVAVPYVDANIYLDGNHPFGSGQIAARTDTNGEAVLSLEEGEHTVIFSKWTSSHSVFASEVYTFVVTANEETLVDESLVTTRATIVATGDAGWGQAFYITGETELLGNWETAYRMSPFSGDEWSFFAHLPVGIEYKVVKGPWINGIEEIPTSSVQWEQGENNQVQFVEFLSNFVTPQF